MPANKLTYFKGFRGRGEAAKIMLVMSGDPYEFEDISFQGWPKKKNDFPTGKLPALLTDDGKYLPQSSAICRYLAKKYGLMGDSLWEEAENDAMMGNIEDAGEACARTLWWVLFGKPKPEDRDKQLEDCREKWKQLAAFIEKKAGSSNFLISDQIQVADVWLYAYLELSSHALPDIMSISDWIKDWLSRFISDERVKKHLDSRPLEDFTV